MNQNIPKSSLRDRVNDLVQKAEEKALEEIRTDDQVKERVKQALANRFRPYILEAETIAEGIAREQYQVFKEETRDFYQSLVNVVACPDGRISVLSLTDPSASYVHRALRGQLRTRLSTSKNELPIPSNTELRAGIWTVLDRMRRKYHIKKPKVVALIGPHIDSEHPLHGCGAAAAALSGIGSGLPAALATFHFGGARNYFRLLQESGEFYALDNFAMLAGADGTTIDYTHDLHSQGVIVGLGVAWKYLREELSLRKNLLRLHDEERIVMSELLVPKLRSRVRDIAKTLDSTWTDGKTLNYQDPKMFGEHAMLIGRVAQELTRQEAKEEYPWLPNGVKKPLDETACRIAAYHILRSAVYLILGGVEPGKHWLMLHPEQVLRVGPIGADFNVKTIAFIESAPVSLSPDEAQSVFALYGLMERFLPALDVDLTREARIVMVTGKFNPDIYKDEDVLKEEFDRVATKVIDDAAKIKMMLKRAVVEGAAVVIPMIHHADTRRVIDIL